MGGAEVDNPEIDNKNSKLLMIQLHFQGNWLLSMLLSAQCSQKET